MTVYLSEYIHPKAQELLRSRAQVVDNFQCPENIDAIILRVLPVDSKVMNQCRNLKVIGWLPFQRIGDVQAGGPGRRGVAVEVDCGRFSNQPEKSRY